jgi:hypothetical protein
MLWTRLLFASVSPRRTGFNAGPIHVGFVMEKVVFKTDFLFGTSVLPVHTNPAKFYNYLHLHPALKEGQAGEAWETSNKAMFYRRRRKGVGTDIFSLERVKVSCHCATINHVFAVILDHINMYRKAARQTHKTNRNTEVSLSSQNHSNVHLPVPPNSGHCTKTTARLILQIVFQNVRSRVAYLCNIFFRLGFTSCPSSTKPDN